MFRSVLCAGALIGVALVTPALAQNNEFLTMCGGGTGALPSPWQRSGNNITFTDGRVGIATSDPQATLHVNGTIRANDLVVGSSSSAASLSTILNNTATTCNAPGQAIRAIHADGTVECSSAGGIGSPDNPMVVEVYNEDTVTWTCQDVNIRDLCGDEDGCKIVALLQHETNGYDQVLAYRTLVYMEQDGLPHNYPGVYGTLESTGEITQWISGDSTAHNIKEFADHWAYIGDYRFTACGGNNSVLPEYVFRFMSHPNVKSRFLIYDHP